MIQEITNNRIALAALCRRYRVHRLRLFGSAATGAFVHESSDLDFVVEFADTHNADYVDRYLDFADALEQLFHRRADIVTERSIRNRYFREEVERTARVVYEERTQEASA
jgi:hypothetical protein